VQFARATALRVRIVLHIAPRATRTESSAHRIA